LVVSRLPNAAATITSLDVQNRIAALAELPPAGLHPGCRPPKALMPQENLPCAEPIGGLTAPGRAVVEDGSG
jgi:hypothetical protein